MRITRGVAAGAVGLALLLVPDAEVAPTSLSLVAVDETTAVDFGEGVVVVLALGSDSRTDEVMDGNADAIELIAVDFETGQAAAVGIPRDTRVYYDGEPEKINDGLPRGGAELMASKVAEVTGVKPDYVLTTGFGGLQGLVDDVGGLSVSSEVTFTDEESGFHFTEGPGNRLDGERATVFARARGFADDFARMANQQSLLRAILDKLRAEEDTEGFIEHGALSALQNLDTNLSPSELYRFAQAISQIDPAQATTCVLTGPPVNIGPNIAVDLDLAYARRVAADAAQDGRLEPGSCQR